MSRRLFASLILFSGPLAAQTIFVQPYKVNNPPSCGIVPNQFQQAFNFYVTIYNSCGSLTQNTTFPMTGTGYCGGPGLQCWDALGDGPAPWPSYTVSGGVNSSM